MINGKSVLAIIPAREGSRRVPDKNLCLFRGKPLIQHAIEHAQGSKYIDSSLIFSSSDAILNYAGKALRRLKSPEYLAQDHTTAEAFIAFILYRINPLPDYFVLLQPTSPLRTSADIDTCLERASSGTGQCISYNEYGKRNGAVYVSDSLKFLSSLSLEDRRTGADIFIMPNSRSLDIDYPQDFNA